VIRAILVYPHRPTADIYGNARVYKYSAYGAAENKSLEIKAPRPRRVPRCWGQRARGVVFLPLRTSHGRGVLQSPSDGGNCWSRSAAQRLRGRSRLGRSSLSGHGASVCSSIWLLTIRKGTLVLPRSHRGCRKQGGLMTSPRSSRPLTARALRCPHLLQVP